VKLRPTRREQPPAALLEHLEAHERVVSWADTDDGTVVAATPRGLWWPAADGGAPRLILWQHIDKAIWRDGRLVVTEADVVDDELLVDRPAVAAVLTRPRDLPPTVRKRVEANIVDRQLLQFAGAPVRFVARRLPGRDGVTWWAHLEPGTPDSAELRAAVRARLAVLRGERRA
jgi:hypothetical protein